MSAQSWLEEFYPERAADAARRGTGAAIEHSLRKWRGATGENLAKHGLMRGREDNTKDGHISLNSESGAEVIVFGITTCALCKLYFALGCDGCPLVDADGKRCFEWERGYDVFAKGGGPEVMISELETALAKWRKEQELYERHN